MCPWKYWARHVLWRTSNKEDHFRRLGHPLFFSVYCRPTDPNFWRFRRRNDVVTPFFTWNNSFNLKNEHSNSIEKNRNKSMNIFRSILYILLIPICRMLTFNVVLGYQGLPFRDFLWLFLVFFFSIRPTDPISGNAFDSKRRKKSGWP